MLVDLCLFRIRSEGPWHACRIWTSHPSTSAHDTRFCADVSWHGGKRVAIVILFVFFLKNLKCKVYSCFLLALLATWVRYECLKFSSRIVWYSCMIQLHNVIWAHRIHVSPRPWFHQPQSLLKATCSFLWCPPLASKSHCSSQSSLALEHGTTERLLALLGDSWFLLGLRNVWERDGRKC